MNKTNRSFIFILFLLVQVAQAQITPPCPFPPPTGAEDCSSTCVYCDLEGYVGINNGTPSGGNTVCGQIVLHNDQWFGFVAGSSSITFTVTPSNCQNGDGLQTAIFADCSASDPLVCNPGTVGNGGNPLSLQYENYTVGQTYFLLVDGWTGDICDFTISISDGLIGAPPADNASIPSGPTKVCLGSTVVYQVPEVENAGYYQWTAPPGASINGMGAFASLEAPEGHSITVTFGQSGGNICVKAGNACNPPSVQSCLTVVNQPIPPTILAPLVICANDLPYEWPVDPSIIIENPGSPTLSTILYTDLGCDSIVKQTIMVLPPIVVNLGQRVLCQGNCFQVGGTSFCNPGVYSEYLSSFQGCDSLVNFSISVLDPATYAPIQAPMGQTITCFQPTLTLLGGNQANVNHYWKNSQGDTLGTNAALLVNTPGYYTHQVVLGQAGFTCSASKKILIKQNTMPPPATATGGTLDASHPTVQLVGNSIISGVTYSWTGPNGFTSNLRKPIVSMPGVYTLTVTNPQTGCSSIVMVEVGMMN